MNTAIINNPIMKPRVKWRINIRFTIPSELHQTYSPIREPNKGIIVKILIITVIPQYDICPQQTQYPIKEARKVKSRITQPETIYITEPNE